MKNHLCKGGFCFWLLKDGLTYAIMYAQSLDAPSAKRFWLK